jgi:predicted TPR repeat methyltransferase
MIEITPELSAQGIQKGTSVAFRQLAERVRETLGENDAGEKPLVVEQGCGLLRNVEVLLTISNRLVLVDTEHQLTKTHSFYGEDLAIPEFVKNTWTDHDIRILTSKKFGQRSLDADVIFSVNVFDVVPPQTREELLAAARRNLSESGILAMVVPRNDTWQLRRCTEDQRYADGYAMPNRGRFTFYHNWTNAQMKDLLAEWGFEIMEDFSRYRYLSVLCILS